MTDLLLYGFIIVSLIQFLISIIIVSKIFYLYRDIASFQLIIVVILGNMTIVFSLMYYYASMLSYQDANLSFKLALFSIISLILVISLVLDKSIYSYRTTTLSKTSFFIFSCVLGIVIYEFFTSKDLFFYIDTVQGQLIPHYGTEPSILIIIGGIILLTCFYFSYQDIRSISDTLVSRTGFFLIFISSATIFSAFLINLVIQTFFIDALVTSPIFNKDFIYLLHFSSLNLMTLSMAYFSYTQPYLNLTTGARPNLLIEKGLIGYFLAYHSDKGPEPLAYSEEFASKNLSFNSLNGLAVSSIVLVGMFSENDKRFVSKVSLIPVPNNENFSALIYTFELKSTKVTDKRFKDQTPSVFAILFPSNLTIAIRNMNETLKNVLDYVHKYDNIEELNKQDNLLLLAMAILRKVLL